VGSSLRAGGLTEVRGDRCAETLGDVDSLRYLTGGRLVKGARDCGRCSSAKRMWRGEEFADLDRVPSELRAGPCALCDGDWYRSASAVEVRLRVGEAGA
jgi:hypothetical protein